MFYSIPPTPYASTEKLSSNFMSLQEEAFDLYDIKLNSTVV
jgi:hypothetical protein